MKNLLPATTVATINKQQIIILNDDGEKIVAIKPICAALGVSYEPQFTKLKNDPLLKSVVTLSVTTGSDGKQYEMVTIPFKYVFGWLFRIDSRNVKPEAQESVLKYQMECYDALYQHFIELDEYLKFRTELAETKWDEVEAARDNFKTAKSKLENLKKEFAEARAMTIDDYRKMKSQMKIEFPDDKEQEGGNDES